MGELTPYKPDPPEHPLVRAVREVLEKAFQVIIKPKQPPSIIEPEYRVLDEPLIIDAEFEVNETQPPPSNPSYPFHWEITPEELRQIRKWKGIDDA
jgi:hypothetical protein